MMRHDFLQSSWAMTSFADFITWATTQRQAAEMLGLSESMVSLILSGKRPLRPQHATRIERVSGGFFRADDLLPDTEFTRDEKGEVVGWHVKAKQDDSKG